MKKLILERVCNNQVKNIFVNVCEQVYQTGQEASKWFLKNRPVSFDQILPQWNYKFTPG